MDWLRTNIIQRQEGVMDGSLENVIPHGSLGPKSATKADVVAGQFKAASNKDSTESVLPSEVLSTDERNIIIESQQWQLRQLQEVISHQTGVIQEETAIRKKLQHRISRLEGIRVSAWGSNSSAQKARSQHVELLERYRDQLEEEIMQCQAESERLSEDKTQLLKENMGLKGRLSLLQVVSNACREGPYERRSLSPDPANSTRSRLSPPVGFLSHEDEGRNAQVHKVNEQRKKRRSKQAVASPPPVESDSGTPRFESAVLMTVTRLQGCHRMEERWRTRRIAHTIRAWKQLVRFCLDVHSFVCLFL
jgi:hypothetical protein